MSNNRQESANNQETESRNAAAGATQNKVETVDYRSSAGGKQQEQRPVKVTHQPHPQPNQKKSNTSGGLLENAAASAATSLQSAKEAISD